MAGHTGLLYLGDVDAFLVAEEIAAALGHDDIHGDRFDATDGCCCDNRSGDLRARARSPV
ncbi:hypothetical protein [Streptomyces sioyaensis]|uniref:hypothetical protein n=1 Tax=Streptomyces sioyaensis TaxID=67364 RepID=UPI00378C5C5F